MRVSHNVRLSQRVPAAVVGLGLSVAILIGGATSASAVSKSVGYFATKAQCQAARAVYVADYRKVGACYLQDAWVFNYETTSKKY